MDIKRSGSQPSAKGPAEYFTGTVRIDPLFETPEPAGVRGGQTLIVTWRDAHDRNDTHCHSGGVERNTGRVDGARLRRAIPGLMYQTMNSMKPINPPIRGFWMGGVLPPGCAGRAASETCVMKRVIPGVMP